MWLGLGVCFTGRRGRLCSRFPGDCRGGQWSSGLASSVRHESKPLPLLLTPCVFSEEAKMSLQCVDMTGTFLLCWIFSGSSHLVCILLHCTTLGKITALPLVMMLRKASECASLWEDVPAPRTSFRYFRYDNDPFKVLIKIGLASYHPNLRKEKSQAKYKFHKCLIKPLQEGIWQRASRPGASEQMKVPKARLWSLTFRSYNNTVDDKGNKYDRVGQSISN